MQIQIFTQLNPRASAHTRLFVASMIWSGMAFFLFYKGYTLSKHAAFSEILILIITGSCLGFLKSWIIFDSVAYEIIKHNHKKPYNACLGGLFSLRNWGIIFGMAFFGKLIAKFSINVALKTTIYIMVGSGLGYSSRLLWKAWRKLVQDKCKNL